MKCLSTSGYRNTKKVLKKLLGREQFEEKDWLNFLVNPQTIISPLFSFLCSTNLSERWHAISALGIAVARLSQTDMEAARVVIRRFMWQLNDESGGIGWGCPEAMGEALRNSKPLAREYSHILLSFVDPKGNMLDNENLVEAALWGLARVAEKHPDTLQRATEVMPAYINQTKTEVCCYSSLTVLFLEQPKQVDYRRKLHDIIQQPVFSNTMHFYWNGKILSLTAREIIQLFLEDDKPEAS